jgi:hypothetical protein
MCLKCTRQEEALQDMYIHPGVCLNVSSLTRVEPYDRNSATSVLANEPPRCHTGLVLSSPMGLATIP